MGAGIECDVRLSGDGRPMLFHDHDLRRLCASALCVERTPAELLQAQRLFDSNEHIPGLGELLSLVQPERLIALTPAWWQERLMEWAGSDPNFRVKLLRFVDVLPALRTPASVSDHVRQYFRGDVHLPVRVGSAVAATGAFRPVLSKVVRQGVFTMADRFIGGDSPEDALPKLRDLVGGGTAYTIDLLGEATLSEQEADVYLRRYLELIDVLARDATGVDAP